jgi:hypothetical protein
MPTVNRVKRVAGPTEFVRRKRHARGPEPAPARVIDLDKWGCALAFVDDARVDDATFSADICRYSVPIQPDHVVLVAEGVVVIRDPLAASVRPRCGSGPRTLRRRVAGAAVGHPNAGNPRWVVADGFNIGNKALYPSVTCRQLITDSGLHLFL